MPYYNFYFYRVYIYIYPSIPRQKRRQVKNMIAQRIEDELKQSNDAASLRGLRMSWESFDASGYVPFVMCKDRGLCRRG